MPTDGPEMQMIEYLVQAMPEYRRMLQRKPHGHAVKVRILHTLMGFWKPDRPLPPEYYALQDAWLAQQQARRGVVDVMTLRPAKQDARLALWLGDITRLRADAIVNAANETLRPSTVPCHECVATAVHLGAGLQLRAACEAHIAQRGCCEPMGAAWLSEGYNLPAKYIIHTVGPAVGRFVHAEEHAILQNCYRACLGLADRWKLESLALPCIATGQGRYPPRPAAHLAVYTVRAWLDAHPQTSLRRVVFAPYKVSDRTLYEEFLAGLPLDGTVTPPTCFV